jgi:hypothetical protein
MIPAKEFEGELWIKASDYHQVIKETQREWVGLTDEEIALVCAECAASAHNWNDISFARAIEAKLKEKNSAT